MARTSKIDKLELASAYFRGEKIPALARRFDVSERAIYTHIKEGEWDNLKFDRHGLMLRAYLLGVDVKTISLVFDIPVDSFKAVMRSTFGVMSIHDNYLKPFGMAEDFNGLVIE